MGVMRRTGRKASEIFNQFTPVPQKLVNLRDIDRAVIAEAPLQQIVSDIESELGDEGRVVLRLSGTEPLIRVMVEALDNNTLDSAMTKLVNAIEAYR